MSGASDRAELTALRAQVDDALARVVGVADRYRDTPDAAVVTDLDTVERALTTATRALARALDALAGPDR